MKPFENGCKKLENLSFEVDARKGVDKVLLAKSEEVQTQLSSLKAAENQVKMQLATMKYYFKDLSQEKKVVPPHSSTTSLSAYQPCTYVFTHVHITLYDEVVDEKDVEAHLKTMNTWKTTLEHHIQGMEK